MSRVTDSTPVVTLADLDHVWLRAYVAETDLGRIRWGQAATVHTDTYPDRAYPGQISFISSEAEFTPKSVETAEEREKLMFRVKLQADPKVLDQYHKFVKTGVRGLAFARTDPKIAWPAELQVKLPQ